jgi:hypothetical protein
LTVFCTELTSILRQKSIVHRRSPKYWISSSTGRRYIRVMFSAHGVCTITTN